MCICTDVFLDGMSDATAHACRPTDRRTALARAPTTLTPTPMCRRCDDDVDDTDDSDDSDEGDEAISIDFPYFLWIYSRG